MVDQVNTARIVALQVIARNVTGKVNVSNVAEREMAVTFVVEQGDVRIVMMENAKNAMVLERKHAVIVIHQVNVMFVMA